MVLFSSWLLLLGCGEPVSVLEPVGCEPGFGEIWWVEGQRGFETLSKALEQDAPWHTVCLGEGTFEVDQDLLELDVDGRVHVIGQGPELTELVLEQELLESRESELVLWPGEPQQLVLEGFTFHFPIEVRAQELVMREVWMRGVSTSSNLMRLGAPELTLDAVRVQDSTFLFAGLLILDSADASPARIDGLQWVDNIAGLGLHILAEGQRDLHFQDLLISGAADSNQGAAYAMVYTYGELKVHGGLLTEARSSGSLLAARRVELRELEILGSRGITGGLIQSLETLDVRELSIQDSRVSDSLFYVYRGEASSVHLESLHLGTELENRTPCSLAIDGLCVESDWGEVESWECTDCGS